MLQENLLDFSQELKTLHTRLLVVIYIIFNINSDNQINSSHFNKLIFAVLKSWKAKSWQAILIRPRSRLPFTHCLPYQCKFLPTLVNTVIKTHLEWQLWRSVLESRERPFHFLLTLFVSFMSNEFTASTSVNNLREETESWASNLKFWTSEQWGNRQSAGKLAASDCNKYSKAFQAETLATVNDNSLITSNFRYHIHCDSHRTSSKSNLSKRFAFPRRIVE